MDCSLGDCRLRRAPALALDHIRQLRAGRADGLLTRLRPKGQLLRAYERDVADPYEAKQCAQVRLLGIHHLGRPLAVEAAARLDDDGALALEQTNWAALVVAECGA